MAALFEGEDSFAPVAVGSFKWTTFGGGLGLFQKLSIFAGRLK